MLQILRLCGLNAVTNDKMFPFDDFLGFCSIERNF